MRIAIASLLVVLAAACQPTQTLLDGSEPPGHAGRCDEAWSEWTRDLAGTDPRATERSLRRVFQRCSESDVDRLSRDIPARDAEGQAVIRDVREFLETECGRQGPPTSNSALCREVGAR